MIFNIPYPDFLKLESFANITERADRGERRPKDRGLSG
jgi:hypothetical protein